MKLEIELVPSTSWYSNVRSNVSKNKWDTIRKRSYKKANYKCEICGDNGRNQGVKWPVECHEIWDYNEETKIQKLTGFISLCTNCHKTKHAGLAIFVNNEKDLVINQLMKVNEISKKEAEHHIEESFKLWERRNQYEWKLDLSYIDM